MQAPSSASSSRRRHDADLDVDAELAQLLKEQDAFMRQNKAPAAKIVRVSRPPPAGSATDDDELPPLEPDADAESEDTVDDQPPMGPQVVGSVRERDVIALNETNRRVMPHCEVGGFPAVKRRGDSLFGRRRRQQADATDLSKRDPSKMLSGMGRIVEKTPSVAATSSSPAPEGVSDSEWAEIDASNTAALKAMSTQEIREAQEELMRSLDPELIAKLRNRRHRHAATASTASPSVVEPVRPTNLQQERVQGSAEIMDLASIRNEEELFDRAKALPAEERAKHEWMQPLSDEAKRDAPQQRKKGLPIKSSSKITATTERFDFNGDVVKSEGDASAAPTHSGLYHHGDDPDAPGYTMDELLHLARSTVASQRAMALVTISKVLNKRKKSTTAGTAAPRVLPPQLPIALRMALDDQNYTALGAAISALHAFLVIPHADSDESVFEGPFGAIAHPPQIHVHINEGTKPDELLREVIYLDTNPSTEDGSVISDEELTSLDPIQGYLKMDIVTRLGYIVSSIQLPDEESIEKILDILKTIAAHSPRAATTVAANRSLVKTLQSKYLENERILTLQVEARDEFTRAVRLAVKTLRFLRVLCMGDRTAATSLIESGLIQSTKGFMALRGEGTHHIEAVQLECLRIWRVLLSYGLDYHCFAYLYPILCGFDGVGLVQEQRSRVKNWSDPCLAAIFAALEAFARLDGIHEAQHYLSQLSFFVTEAKNQVLKRLELNDHVSLNALRFLSAACRWARKYLTNVQDLQAVNSALLSRAASYWGGLGEASPDHLLVAVEFCTAIVDNDLLEDDEDDASIRLQLLRRAKAPFLQALSALSGSFDDRADTVPYAQSLNVIRASALVGHAANLVCQAEEHDDAFVQQILTRALEIVPRQLPGHQFWLHSIFSRAIFDADVLVKSNLFVEANDARTMGHVLTPIYQALVNSTKEQEDHSRVLFDTTSTQPSPRSKSSCHLVIPQEENQYVGSNLPLPSFWMFCPFSRLEYTSSNAESNGARHAATTLGPSHAEASEMKIIISAACRFIYQIEQSTHLKSSNNTLLAEDKLFHLMHVFFAGAEVLFDEHVDRALSMLLPVYAASVVRSADPNALFNGILRNVRRFEHLEHKGEQADEKKNESDQAPISFASDADVVSSFIERIVQEFMSSSFGNAHFARTVTLFLLHDFPLSIRKWVWKELTGSHMLHHLAPFSSELWLKTGERCTRDAKKSDEALIQLLKQVVTSSDQGSFVFWLAMHHVVAYLFGDDTSTGEFSFARRLLLQELVSAAPADVWKGIVSYDISSSFPSAATSTSLSSLQLKESRVDRIRAHGALDASLLAKLA
ncbi:hypothetical protein PINS_up008500 [Pythium insidiosum]|nr:hypothetical protein PINS_up008500 [Pythium insidiosum]